MQNKLKFNAVSLRNTLIASIGVLVLVGIGGFFLLERYLSSIALEVNDSNVQAAASSKDLAQLQQLESEMADNQVAITRAASVVGDSKQYQYQDQIINDLSSYAKTAGFQIQSFAFSDQTLGAPSAGNVAPGATAAPTGLKISTVTVTLPQDLSYTTIMTFLKSIEQNLTKMELTGVSLAVDQASGRVTIQPITIGVYTR